MIAPHGHDDGHAREIARGLASAVRAAAGAARATPVDSSLAWAAAADVAELLQLEGLAALLSACRAHAGAPPLQVAHVLERLERLTLESDARGDITPFVQADRELAALAGVLQSQDWAAAVPPELERVAVQPLGELLSDLDVDDPALLARAHLTLPVAAGLRAALDWLGADLGGPLHIAVQDAALTLSFRVMHEPGLAPAGAVLSLLGGALLHEPDGRWALRVPLHAERPAFLLARQGELSVALPWTAVARLRIADEQARTMLTEPSLAPWSPLLRTTGERPMALLAQGLSRAWLHLDHIIWRVFARPEPAHAPAQVPGGRLVVRAEDGAEYWVVDAHEALTGVPELHTPPTRLRPRTPAVAVAPAMPAPRPESAPIEVVVLPAPRPESAPIEVVVLPAPRPESAPIEVVDVSAPAVIGTAATSSAAMAPRQLVILGREHVRAVHRPVAPFRAPVVTVVSPAAKAFAPPAALVAPAPPPVAPLAAVVAPLEVPAPAPPAAAPAPATLDAGDVQPLAGARRVPSPRRALVVDDSLVARIALTRVLEREGWVVEGAEHASEMWAALESEDWSAVFVDVSLPDASGRAHLRQLVARQLVARARFELVALTRDGSEDQLVAGTGITRVLRKPFVSGAVEALVRDLPGIAAGQ